MNTITTLVFFRKLILITLFFLLSASTPASENVFYILHSSTPQQILKTDLLLNHLSNHAKKINIIISQAYRVDTDGVVTGFVDANLMKFTKEQHIKLLALVTNVGFDKDKAHLFLSNPAAQKRTLDALLKACQDNHYDGIQMDFEGVSIQDKAALTQFYLTLAKELHAKGLIVSYAVVPTTSDDPHTSEFQKRRYENWAGVYDLKALGRASDFISLMAYDQHGQGTLPGPIGGYQWLQAIIKHALIFIPANKLSLGIPVYSGYWVMTDRPNKRVTMQMNQISYKEVEAIIKDNHLKLTWDKQDKINYVFFNHNWLYHHLFIEDAKAFKEKYALVGRYHLRGISVFSLGNEDPSIWNALRDVKK